MWLWKSLGTVLVGLTLNMLWDLGGYMRWLGNSVRAHELRFNALDARLNERREERDRDIENLKERDGELQQLIDQNRQDIRSVAHDRQH